MAELDGPRWGPASKGDAEATCGAVPRPGRRRPRPDRPGADLGARAAATRCSSRSDAPFPHDSGFGRQWWSVADRTPAVMEAGVRRAAGVPGRVHRRRTGAAGAAGGRLRADGVQPGRDDGAVHRPAPRRRAARHPGVLRRPDRARDVWPPSWPTARPCCWCMARRTTWCRSQRSRDAEAALRAAGVPVEAVYVPRLGHGIDDTGLAMGALALQRGLCRYDVV